jgi:hypothetical protein
MLFGKSGRFLHVLYELWHICSWHELRSQQRHVATQRPITTDDVFKKEAVSALHLVNNGPSQAAASKRQEKEVVFCVSVMQQQKSCWKMCFLPTCAEML